ncbi:unnamed protein product [Kuraishia capsulata CBS 1993]|uniref:Uncharacterized protein n=1 Tax=Kuraishia capsulata CBS 1993 TaxID=1382522 RepID=W6MLR5_9ASCO|nr:uncharacterized protein KUCA_T00003424001 [Kuraishia capsulata CBS 1993]CDK27446.1 unnamed protein product [Kuraishia capsulata CBS 1993]
MANSTSVSLVGNTNVAGTTANSSSSASATSSSGAFSLNPPAYYQSNTKFTALFVGLTAAAMVIGSM